MASVLTSARIVETSWESLDVWAPNRVLVANGKATRSKPRLSRFVTFLLNISLSPSFKYGASDLSRRFSCFLELPLVIRIQPALARIDKTGTLTRTFVLFRPLLMVSDANHLSR